MTLVCWVTETKNHLLVNGYVLESDESARYDLIDNYRGDNKGSP